MDVRGWRKWLRTPASIGTSQNQEVGMLKHLLGHWKSHRKKPSLLPEDGDIRFEKPSRINPLFEDSDESTTSSKSPSDLSPKNRTLSASQEPNEENQNQADDPVVNDLIDISVPKLTSDNLETALQEIDAVIAASELETVSEVTESIPSKTNLRHFSEIAESVSEETSQKTVLKETETTTFEEIKINDSRKNKDSLSNKTQSDSGNVKDESALNSPQTSQLGQLSNEKTVTHFPSGDNTKVAEVKSTDSMRIFDQASISAIKHTKLTSDEAASEKVTHQSSEPKSSKNQILKKSGNAQKQPENINGKYERNNTNSDSKTTTFNENNSFFKPEQSNQQQVDPEKPAKLRARAIDELIKKFQGSTSDNATDKFSSDKKSLLNSPTEKSDAGTNVAKIEKKYSPIKSEESTKETKTTSTPEKKEITGTKHSQASTSKKSEIEKEALSNIFKFPPPPPIDKFQNESSLHGKIVKERKSAEILASPSVLTNDGNNSKETETSKTRSDSSLDRTRTASSNKLEAINEKQSHSEANNKAKDSLSKQPIERLPSDNKKIRTKDLATEQTSAKESKIEKEAPPSKTLPEQKASTSNVNNVKINPETIPNKTEPKLPTGGLFVKKESSVSSSELKPQPLQENRSSLHQKSTSSDQKKASDFPVAKKRLSLSKKFSNDLLNNESENVKSHSEDSGITRGDQISSETTQEAAPVVNSPAEEMPPAQNPIRKSRRDKKLRSINKKPCKNCKRSHEDNASIKKIQYDAYYDGLTGNRHLHKSKHSDSLNSDLSWEERELIRRLRSKRGTVRSNTPSTRSRHSRHRFTNEDHFRRHHSSRRSSDESSFYGASSCSCDDCWVAYVKDYAYARASLRGMPPIQEMCTCRASRHNFLGRRVKFHSDTILEASPSERTTETSTPAPSAENKQEDTETDGRSSQQSSRTKDDDSVLKHPGGIKEKKAKFPEEAYRIVSPWELEEWDLFMRKELLKRRRRRARCMGIMALAMVVFVGLVVAILMVYLRRKII